MNVLNNPILNTDSYKASHWLQYPPGTTQVRALASGTSHVVALRANRTVVEGRAARSSRGIRRRSARWAR